MDNTAEKIVREINNGSHYDEIGRAITAAQFRGRVITELEYIKKDIDNTKKTSGKHENRIKSLEEFKKTSLLIVAGFSIFASQAWDLLKSYIVKHF